MQYSKKGESRKVRQIISIGTRIKQYREALGLTKAELAVKVGLPRAPITRYEKKGDVPSPEVIRKLVGALGVSADYLLGRMEDKEFFKNPALRILINDIKNLPPVSIDLMCKFYCLLLEQSKINIK